MTTGADAAGLLAALDGLGEQLRLLSFPLELVDADAARRLCREICDQLDDYLLPRLRRMDAPVLAVVGGSTGAGKSTLVNSLVGQQVSAVGVLRPTTRSAILACHPDDHAWFASCGILPRLGRTTSASADPANLQLVASPSLPAGLAVLDAPDIDSVVTANRELATQLLAAADMWLFVTTAGRYADAVPWEFLRAAVTRGTAVAIVLNRVAPEAVDEVRAHLATLLTEQGFGRAPLFVVPATTPVEALLPAGTVDMIRQWLQGIAVDAVVRTDVVQHTLKGAVRSLPARVLSLAAASDAQAETAARLRREVEQAYDAARARVEQASADGSLVRGEVLARWQELVGSGELTRAIRAPSGRRRDRPTDTRRTTPPPVGALAEAIAIGFDAVVRAAADEAADRADVAWRDDPAGTALLGEEDLPPSFPSLTQASLPAVRGWQRAVCDLLREQDQRKRAIARRQAFDNDGLGVLLTMLVFAQLGRPAVGDVAVDSASLSRTILEAVLGDQVVRTLAATARADLLGRVAELLDGERARYLKRLPTEISEDAGSLLRAAAQDIEDAQ
jgi:hypothetical protein